MSILDALRQEFVYEAGVTAKLLERAPDEKLGWRPHKKSMTLQRLSGHIAELPLFILSILNKDELDFVKEGYTPFEPATRAELVAQHAKNVSAAEAGMQGISDEHMMQPWRLRGGDQVYFELPRVAALRSMVLNHIVHHRGQLTVYLRLLDVPLPGVYGPSADENP
ncbi:MAG TPA: DinB family protein [Candidatus Hydrogenedentes bacterium]|nr:DinB family protein [Candidatus Hydrogenedentota bacterium]